LIFKEVQNKKLCYGTTEYKKSSIICKACTNYISCGKEYPKIKRYKKRSKINGKNTHNKGFNEKFYG